MSDLGFNHFVRVLPSDDLVTIIQLPDEGDESGEEREQKLLLVYRYDTKATSNPEAVMWTAFASALVFNLLLIFSGMFSTRPVRSL